MKTPPVQPSPPLDLDWSVSSDSIAELYDRVQRDELLLRQRWLSLWTGHCSLIEPSIGSTAGVPDAFLANRTFDPGWVEFKATNGDGLFKLEPAQRYWMRSFAASSPRCAIVVMDELGFFTFSMGPLLEGDYQRFYSPQDLPRAYPYVAWEGLREADLILSLRAAYAPR